MLEELHFKMRGLKFSELAAITGAAISFSQNPYILNSTSTNIYVTNDSYLKNTGNFLGVTAKISLYSDRIETIDGKLLLSGPGNFDYDGYHIYADSIPNGQVCVFFPIVKNQFGLLI